MASLPSLVKLLVTCGRSKPNIPGGLMRVLCKDVTSRLPYMQTNIGMPEPQPTVLGYPQTLIFGNLVILAFSCNARNRYKDNDTHERVANLPQCPSE